MLALAAAQWVVQTIQARLQVAKHFSLVLSGGSTPQALYRQLANFPYATEIDWTRLHVFWGDERCVPPNHPQSNYRMAYQALLDHVPVPREHIHRMRGEQPPEEAAKAYAQELAQFFSERQPQFDLVLLGIGADGHTASLFPHSAALKEDQRWVVANYAPSQASWRITLTIPALNAARQVAFLVSGADKANTLQRVLEGPYQPDELPAQFIQPAVWMVDAAAASLLSR
jgi:6-phosphogluconolactonase